MEKEHPKLGWLAIDRLDTLAVAEEEDLLERLLLGKVAAADGAESSSFGLVFKVVVVAFSADEKEYPKLGRVAIDSRLNRVASSSSSNIWPAFL